MGRTYINELKNNINKTVRIDGWVDVRRDHGKLVFIDLRDTTGVVQTVIRPDSGDAYEIGKTLRNEWVVSVEGIVQKRPEKMVNKESETGDIEFIISSVNVLSQADELPFDRDEKLNLDTYLDNLPLTLRTKRAQAIFKVQTTILQAFRSFLVEKGFIEFQSPKLIGEDAEGGASVFEVDYFDHTAHLAQSPQFYKQIMVGVYEKVFTTGNVYRAEKHSTSRHLNEYTSLDMEMGFIKDHRDIMNISGELMTHITITVEKTCTKELALFNTTPIKIPMPIPHLTLRDAQEIIKKNYGEDCSDEPDLSPQHERWLSEYALKEHKSDFLFVTHFPIEKTAMYAYEDEDNLGYSRYFDLLFRGIEIQSGGQRQHNYDKLVKAMERKKLDPKKFSFYLQAFKYGMPPHGGFGMGLERLTAKFLGLENVKEATLFPREINRIDTLLSQ